MLFRTRPLNYKLLFRSQPKYELLPVQYIAFNLYHLYYTLLFFIFIACTMCCYRSAVSLAKIYLPIGERSICTRMKHALFRTKTSRSSIVRNSTNDFKPNAGFRSAYGRPIKAIFASLTRGVSV
ncbi:hypothetical protein Tcan_06755 [Toxocara canis]|uniref:Uncharacterized protein n=1 Tax=Toxocara canis TaxID=6265 RepID=A0A0B2W4I6_TOXCA|nr:hypothetical protein Tcan_06755 [Toxocara canis]